MESTSATQIVYSDFSLRESLLPSPACMLDESVVRWLEKGRDDGVLTVPLVHAGPVSFLAVILATPSLTSSPGSVGRQ